MKVIINHLTRMKEGYICVAGVQLGPTRHIRPVLADAQQLGTALLARYGGAFDIGVVVELGAVTPIPTAPETEDHVFEPGKIRSMGPVSAERFGKLVELVSKQDLRAIFGDALTKRGGTSCGVDPGNGTASLGCLKPAQTPNLDMETRQQGRPQIRMRLADVELGLLDLSVTDIRLYGKDHVTPDRKVVDRLNRRLRRGGEVVLGVGLTRVFRECHWLQVNNVHFADDPLWQLA